MAAQFTRLNAVMKPTPGPRPPSTPATGLTRRATLAWAALAVQAGSARAAPEVQDDTWRDTARGRDIPVRLRWPAHPGPWPLLVYSHGLGGSRQGADAWGQAWCEAGFLVLHLQHLGSDAEVLRRSGLAGLRAAGNGEQLIARAADVRAVLDGAARRQRDGDTRWTLVRLDAVGMAGHSFGALTSLAVAGQRHPMQGDLSDPRPRAFIALSPPSPNKRMSLQAQFGAIRRPVMLFTGSLDADPFGGHLTGEPRARVYEGLPPGRRALLWLDGADHGSFGGSRELRSSSGRRFLNRAQSALALEDTHHTLVARLSTLWWRQHLLDDADASTDFQAAPQQPRWSAGDRLTLG